MKCDEARNLMVDRLTGEVEAVADAKLEDHLSECRDCRGELAALADTWNRLGALPAPPLPEALETRFGMGLGRKRVPSWMLAAAAVLLLALGGAGGWLAAGSGSAPVSEPRFMLLTRADDSLNADLTEDQLFREYSEWAAGLEASGNLLVADPLWDEGVVLNGDVLSDVSGFFLITAADMAEARSLAGSSPHARYGGVLEIRQVGTGGM